VIAVIQLLAAWMLIGGVAAMVGMPRLRPEQTIEPFCVGCGCTPSEACITPAGPCDWAAIHPSGEYGICTECAALPIEDLLRGMWNEIPTELFS
jgi:hypothetical protein